MTLPITGWFPIIPPEAGTVAISVTPTITASGSVHPAGSVDITVTPTITASGLVKIFGSSAIVVTPTVAVTPGGVTAAAAIVVTPTVTPVGKVIKLGSSAITVTPTVSAAGSVTTGPAFDAVGTGFCVDSPGSSHSFTHVAAAGADVIVSAASDNDDVLTATYGGTSMTSMYAISFNNDGVDNGLIHWFKITGVAGGSATVNISGFTAGGVGAAASVSYTGVTTIGTPATTYGSSASLSQSVTCSAGQAIVQAFGTGINASPMTTSGGTNRVNAHDTSNNLCFTLSTAAATTTFTATPNTSTPWAGIGVVLS